MGKEQLFSSRDLPPIPECKFLSQADQENLEQSGVVIIKKLLNDFGEKLPDAIILPDTGARPLFYLLRTVLDEVATQRGVDTPRFYFFRYNRSLISERRIDEERAGIKQVKIIEEAELEFETADKAYQDYLENEYWNMPAAPREILGDVDRLREYKRPWKERLDELEEIKNEASSRLFTLKMTEEKVKPNRELAKERAGEIDKDLKSRGISSPQIAVVDDFISAKGYTAEEITTAFGRQIPIYGFLSSVGEEELYQLSIPARIGIPYWQGINSGFDYRGKPAVGVAKDRWDVEKYVDALRGNGRDINEIKNLRKDMGIIGKRIINQLDL